MMMKVQSFINIHLHVLMCLMQLLYCITCAASYMSMLVVMYTLKRIHYYTICTTVDLDRVRRSNVNCCALNLIVDDGALYIYFSLQVYTIIVLHRPQV